MVTQQQLSDQTAIELPAREMLQRWTGVTVNVAVPIIIQNNISVQICAIGCTQYMGGQLNDGTIIIVVPAP